MEGLRHGPPVPLRPRAQGGAALRRVAVAGPRAAAGAALAGAGPRTRARAAHPRVRAAQGDDLAPAAPLAGAAGVGVSALRQPAAPRGGRGGNADVLRLAARLVAAHGQGGASVTPRAAAPPREGCIPESRRATCGCQDLDS